MAPAYDAYCFDLYGTLVDIHTDEKPEKFWRTAADFYTRHGAPWEGPALRGAYLDLCRRAEAALLQRYPGALVELDLAGVFRDLYAAKGLGAGEDLVDQTARFFRSASTCHLRVYAGAWDLLLELRATGAKVILVSNAQSCFTRPELEALGLTDCFDRICISSEAGFRKPDPRFYRWALEPLGLDPARCLMIGNDPDCDVRGARAAGLEAFYVHSAYRLPRRAIQG